MKKLVDLVQIVENNRDCVILEVVGSMLDLIKLGCFNGDEIMFRLTKGKDHTCTVWTKEGKNYSWSWGRSGYTFVSNAMSQRGRLIQQCIEQDFEIYIGENSTRIGQTLYIKSLEDVKHNTHKLKLMYWESSKNQVCCHLDDEFHTYFNNIQSGINHFESKGYDVKPIDSYIASTGCVVKVYNMTR